MYYAVPSYCDFLSRLSYFNACDYTVLDAETGQINKSDNLIIEYMVATAKKSLD